MAGVWEFPVYAPRRRVFSSACVSGVCIFYVAAGRGRASSAATAPDTATRQLGGLVRGATLYIHHKTKMRLADTEQGVRHPPREKTEIKPKKLQITDTRLPVHQPFLLSEPMLHFVFRTCMRRGERAKVQASGTAHTTTSHSDTLRSPVEMTSATSTSLLFYERGQDECVVCACACQLASHVPFSLPLLPYTAH